MHSRCANSENKSPKLRLFRCLMRAMKSMTCPSLSRAESLSLQPRSKCTEEQKVSSLNHFPTERAKHLVAHICQVTLLDKTGNLYQVLPKSPTLPCTLCTILVRANKALPLRLIQLWKCLAIQLLEWRTKALVKLWRIPMRTRTETGFWTLSISTWEAWPRRENKWKSCKLRLDRSKELKSIEELPILKCDTTERCSN